MNGKWEDGCILTLQDRAVLAWFTGILRIKTFGRVIPFADIANVTETAVEPARLHGHFSEMVTFSVESDPPVKIRVPRFKNSSALDTMVKGILAGAVTFTYSGDTAGFDEHDAEGSETRRPSSDTGGGAGIEKRCGNPRCEAYGIPTRLERCDLCGVKSKSD